MALAQREIGASWDRNTLNAIKENFNELFKEYTGAGLDAAEAKEKAIQAVADSLYAKETAETTRDELTRIIREQTAGGDVVPEVVQARGTHSTVGDRLNSISQGLAQTMAGINNMSPVKTPTGFNWTDHPLKNKIFTDSQGNFFLKDFNIRDYKPNGKVYYVDVNNGDDSNDGLTLNTALRSIRAAYDKSDSTVIKVAEGFYNRDFGMSGRVIDKDLSIEALPGHDVTIAQVANVNWQPYSGNVYSSNTTNVKFILDTKFKDDFGDHYKYEKVSTIAEVESSPGTYCVVSGTTYIHTFDSRTPDNDTVWRFVDYALLNVESGGTLYLEGLKVFGGNNPLLVKNKSSTELPKVYAKDCDFKYSNDETYDVVHIQGAKVAIFENCSASNGLKDGFNYYPLNGIPTNSIEINCVGRNNGIPTRGSDQGSTQHAGGKTIRINGIYNNNYGSNIADDGEGTQSWNMGCIGFESQARWDSQNSNFFAYPDVDMWLDGCLGYDSKHDIGGPGNIRVRNNNLMSDLESMDSSSPIEY